MGAFGAIASSKLKLKYWKFGGTNEYINIGNHAEYQFERTASFSLSAWIRYTSLPNNGVLVGKVGASPFAGYNMAARSDGSIAFNLANDDASPGFNRLVVDTNTGLLNDGRWHHVVFTYSGTSTPAGITCYIDGTSVSLNTLDNSLSASILNSGPLAIGIRPNGSIGPLQADLHDVAVYNKTLSSAEVATLYNSRCPPRLEAVGPMSNLKGFWRPDLNIVPPTVNDLSSSNRDGTMTNMEGTADIFSR